MNTKNFISAIFVGAAIFMGVHFWAKNHTTTYTYPSTYADYARVTAMITNAAGNHGGTGVILWSTPTLSAVLTNAHVCALAKKGAVVHTNRGKSFVSSYQVSNSHDLCLIKVHSDLGYNTEVSETAPVLYDEATVTGHPQLLPTIIKRGNFSEKKLIEIMTGFRPCTKEEYEGPSAGMCVFFGGIPVIRTFESQVIGAFIAGGNSGSAVFDSTGRIAGLVFAGSGGYGPGLIVPQEYVYNFLYGEIEHLKVQKPDFNTEPDLEEKANKKLRDTCKEGTANADFALVKDFCKFVDVNSEE